MKRTYLLIPFERYANDIVCHCESVKEAQTLWRAIADRLAACKLVLHPNKTKIVYCKDKNRPGDYPNCSFDFLGFCFRARKTIWKGKIPAHSFMPAARRDALKRISRTIRRWTLHHGTDKSLQDLAEKYNPYIRGWINYYSHFYRSRLRPVLHHIDELLFRWARRKFKRMRGQSKGARRWLERVKHIHPSLFAHWTLRDIGGRTS